MNIIYFLIRLFSMFICKIYYRKVQAINAHNVPKKGPVIVFPNHNNCYIDGSVLINILPRQVSMLAAAVTYRCSSFLGAILELTGSIPLERSWDVAYDGKGIITSIKNGNVVGKGTNFKNCKLGDIFEFKKGKQFKIMEIGSDEQIKIKSHDYQFSGEEGYRIIPKLSYEQVYHQVWKALDNQKCIAIFPEGDTHDKMELLPLKLGICIATLGAIEKYGKPVTLVPCGMSFQNQHKFRSKMTVEFGQAFEVPQNIIDLYKTNKHAAINSLFQIVNKLLKDITIQFKHYEEYDTLKTIHSIFQSATANTLTPKERMDSLRSITKNFSQSIKSVPTNFQNKVKKAMRLSLKTKLLLPTLQVLSKQEMFSGAFIALLMMGITTILMIPGLLMYYIASRFVVHFAQQQRLASYEYTKNRRSRLFAYDVVSSYMFLHSVWIMPIATIINFTILYLHLAHYAQYSAFTAILICLVGIIVQPFYALLFVNLIDVWNSSLQKLRKCFYYVSNRSIVMDMIELRRDIMSYTAFNLLGKKIPSKHSHQE